MQKRLHKYRRDPGRLEPRRITDRSLEIISIIERYWIIPTSFITSLTAGNERITARHLQTLYHQGFINRFCFPRIGNPSEFHYYLDDTRALDLLVTNGAINKQQLDYGGVRRNREKRYCDINFGLNIDDLQGRLMHLHHELMISRFHFMLEAGCRAAAGKVQLTAFKQGSELWRTVEVPKLAYNRDTDTWKELEQTEFLPHRPDAFFTLYFPNEPEGKRNAHFFYEADRKHATTKKHNRKLRAHFYYIVKQKRQREDYGIRRVRVLVESTHDYWANELRVAARHEIVSGATPSPLFWFTTSALFTERQEVERYGKIRNVPLFLLKPEVIFKRIWLTPADPDEPEKTDFKSLLD
jgi:hypothetical protein